MTMKTISLIITFLFFTGTQIYASGNPESVSITASIDIDLSIDKIGKVSYNEAKENINFATYNEIAVIHIYDDENKLVFQLPIMSHNVTINKNLFDVGNYKLGFLMSGQKEIQFSQISIKE